MIKKIEDRFNIIYRYQLPFIFSWFRRKKPNHQIKKIYFYPNLPHKRTILYKICKHLGIRIARSSKGEKQISFFWDDSTKFENTNLIDSRSLNSECIDISKHKVDTVFKNVFGYDLSINPKQFIGECVVKSDENAKHDGRIIQCPIKEAEPDVVYQKLIDNKIDDNFVRDLRAPIIGNDIPLVYYKIKTTELRFTNEIDRVEVHQTSTVFNDNEVESILNFSKAMGLDYGELDILRDNENNKIYIVDVNKTPWGPPNTITKEKANYVIEKMSESFLSMLFDF
ncbi:MAG: hypothetical protein HND52_19430 [Ignavibacteriae bacterium]|nr:hypothetical protein [Ignavibacteriota bacterium]NOH00139.1 hypothetical protein [Ignavibacteriota bacterium]